MRTTIRGILIGLCIALVISAQQMPQTKTEKIAGAATVTTEQLHGTVVEVEGRHLLVKMSTGEERSFDVPESRRFLIDGKELTVSDLKPGTKLTATVTTTKTPITERTTTVGSGKVWHVQGNTVILTLPNNENRMYKVKDSYRFMVDGQPATVHDLRKGMVVAAEKIVEEPKTELATNIAVTGQAPPPPKREVAAAPAPPPPTLARKAPAPAPVAERAAPPPPPPPVEKAEAAPPAKLPKTGSPFPLIGAIGLICTATSLGLRKIRSR
jgi:hypothetical protein